ncbi:MAG TPA: hypothetical protein VI933_02540 [archaeon]|nr:hypothetical protein [archaeon]
MVSEVLIPVRFYGYDSIIYFISALIGFLITYRALKLHQFTGAPAHRNFYLSFLLLSAGMLTLSLSTGYTYAKYFEDHEFIAFNGLFDVADLGYWVYFLSSLAAYVMLLGTYTGAKEKFAIGFLITFNYYTYFNVILFFLISLVAFRAAANWLSKRSTDSMLVALGFVLIAAYHGLQLFTFASKIVYVLSNLALILGFLSLLVMLIRVEKYGTKISK